MHFVYIIESINNGRWYIGSSKDVYKRLQHHNSGKVRSTKPYRPYKIVYIEETDSRHEALKRERQIKKSGIIRKAIKSRIDKHGPIV